MANQEQLAILKQGIEVWNKWRNENRHKIIDLAGADLHKADLSKVDLTTVNLRDSNLREALLIRGNLQYADLTGADLSNANLENAYVGDANLWTAKLSGANLLGAIFRNSNLSAVNLSKAFLRESDFRGTNLVDSNLTETDLNETKVGATIFGGINLGRTIGLEEVIHYNFSIVDTYTLQRSKGKIPAAFLRGCGLSDFEIESAKLYNPDLSNQEINDILYKIYDLRARQSIQVSPLFISYCHADAAFVDRLEVVLNEKGIRFWRDIHDAKAGRLETQIEQAIRHNPTVLVILSKNAIESDWVQHEVTKARGLEKELKRDVLCPVALDDCWKTSPWPERVMEQVMEYNILDFSKWQDEKIFEQMFVKLLDGLQLFYKK